MIELNFIQCQRLYRIFSLVLFFVQSGIVAELPTLRKTEFGRKVREEEKAKSTQQNEV